MKTKKEVSAIIGLTERKIQELERYKLIEPTTINKYGHFLYDEKAVDQLWILKFYKELGYKKPQLEELKKANKLNIVTDDLLNKLIQKRDKLNDLISIAEAMNKTGYGFNSIRRLLLQDLELKGDRVLTYMAKNVLRWDQYNEKILKSQERLFSDEEEDNIIQFLDMLVDCHDDGILHNEKAAQDLVKNIHQIMASQLSDSIYMFKPYIECFELGSDVADVLAKKIGESKLAYIRDAFKCYVENNQDNSSDKLFASSFENIIKLMDAGYEFDAECVKKQVENVYKYYCNIKVLPPELIPEIMQNMVVTLQGILRVDEDVDEEIGEDIVSYLGNAMNAFFECGKGGLYE